MAITLVQSNSDTSWISASHTISLSAAPTAGNLLVATINYHHSIGGSPSFPAGWDVLFFEDRGSNHNRLIVGAKVADGSETALTVTTPSGAAAARAYLEYSGVALSLVRSGTYAGLDPRAITLDESSDSGLVVCFVASDGRLLSTHPNDPAYDVDEETADPSSGNNTAQILVASKKGGFITPAAHNYTLQSEQPTVSALMYMALLAESGGGLGAPTLSNPTATSVSATSIGFKVPVTF